MRSIKVNQIKSVLDEYSSRLSNGKVYSVLFVSELDDYVKYMIEEWLDEQKKKGFTYCIDQPRYFYETDPQGFLRKTSYYGYFGKGNIVFDNIEMGYGKDEDYKSDYVNAVLNLKNKEGIYHNDDIQLVIIRALNPAWVNNNPLFSTEDSSLFDEIINIELDKEVFKEMYLSKIEGWIRQNEEKIKSSDSTADIEKIKARVNKGKNRYDLVRFVLNHEGFEFVPLKRLEGEYDSVTGTATDGFSPVNFCNIFDLVSTVDDVREKLNYCGLSEKYEKMLLEIVNEYKQ